MDRRTLMKVAVNAMGAAVTMVVGIPAALSVLSPLRPARGGPRWQTVGDVEQFALDEMVLSVVAIPRNDWAKSLREMSVYVWRTGEAEFTVFSRSCTDLGCPVKFDAGSECFFCPCHGGIFSKEGHRMAGPPPRPLYRYATRIEGRSLEIDLNSIPPMA